MGILLARDAVNNSFPVMCIQISLTDNKYREAK